MWAEVLTGAIIYIYLRRFFRCRKLYEGKTEAELKAFWEKHAGGNPEAVIYLNRE